MITPWLSSHWVGLVTPVPSALARPLAESLRHDAVAAEHDITRYVPDPPGGLTGFDEAVRLTLQRIREADVATRWTSASLPGAPGDPLPTDPHWTVGSLYQDMREKPTQAPPGALWQIIEGIGGQHGWHSLPLARRARGWLDRAATGRPAARQTRPRPPAARRRPRLLAGQSDRTRPPAATARRNCRWPGRLRGWHTLLPLHTIVLGAMASNITRAAQRHPGTSP